MSNIIDLIFQKLVLTLSLYIRILPSFCQLVWLKVLIDLLIMEVNFKT